MNILELDSYNLGDAVKFNDHLNPKLWDASEHLKPEVKAQLLMIAEDFREFLGVTDLDLQDITISGSNAAYTYTPNSDIDLHLVVKMPNDPVYRELFDAKKFQYNEQHNIKIGGYDVELYVQDADQPHISQGIYSILNDDWIQVPRRVKSVVDDTSTENKFKTIGLQIERAIKSGSLTRMTRMAEKIKKMRQTGLEQHGEFGPENLAFKMLRTQGKIKQLYDARNAAKDQELSLDERRKSKKKKRVKYGFGGYWYPGTGYAGQDTAAAQDSGGGDGGGESIREDAAPSDEEILKDFVKFCVAELKIESMPTVKLRRDPQWSVVNRTFGRYINDAHLLEVAFGQRHIMDVLRTVAHELTHAHQHEREAVPTDAGETGSPYENEANARAGVLMRDYGQQHPELFDAGENELVEGASGYIPTKAQAKDPRYSMALTVDIKPGQVGKEANKFKLKTDKQGVPQIANPNGLFEELMLEFQLAKEGINAPISKTKDAEQYYQFIVGKAKLGRPLTRGEQDYVKMYQMYRQQKLAEGATQNQGQVRQTLNAWMDQDQQYTDPTQRAGFQAKVWPYIQKNIQSIMSDKGADGKGSYPAAPYAAWLLVQHMDAYPQNQVKFLQQLTQSGLDPGGKLQFLRDRAEVNQWILKNANNKEYYVNGKPLPNPTVNVRNPALFKDAGMVATSRKEALANAEQAGNKLLVAAVRATNAQTQPSFRQTTTEAVAEGAADHVRMVMSRAADIMKQRGFRAVGQLSDQDLEQIARETDATRHDVDIILNIDHAHELAESTEVLDEVKMSPSALQKWAKSPAAQGIRAGFEAELIFRDTNSGDDSDYDMEPDYDMDERARSISQVIDFFSNGEYSSLSDRQQSRLQDDLDESYMNWLDDEMRKAFRDEQEDLIKKVLVDEGDWDLDNEIQKQLELLNLSDDEMNAIIQAGEKAPKFTSSKEQTTYAEANPLYNKYLDAQSEAEDLLDELVQDSIRAEDKFYDAALDDFRDGFYLDDDSAFFDDTGNRYMSDIASNYDLDWPYMTNSGNNGGSREWDDIGDSLQSAVDMPVKVSSNYHSTTRKEGLWIVEPDTSLQPDDSEDFGLEIVSPPLPLEQALEKLQAVTDWANSPEGNAYTNSSTGLHMGVSVPFKGGDVDYLKLILFLGDEYVLQSFGREANTYTKSAMSKFRENIRGGRADPMGAIKLMQHGLLELAYKEIQKGVGEGKYTSAHIQKGYIEFRSAGGDWLAEENADPEKLSSTMLRYARAMSIAANASEERREYAKKLYKLVAPEGDSQLALFSQYAAGELTAEQLKKKWAEKTIGTEKKMNQRWKLYQMVNGTWTAVPGQEYNGYTEDEVKMRVWSKYGREALDTGEYQLVNMGEQDWEVYDVKTGVTLEIVKGKSKGEVADAVYDKYVDQGIGFQVRPYEDPATMTPRAKLAKRIAQTKKPTAYNYEIVNLGDVNLGVVDQFYAADKQEADKTFDKWLEMKGLPNDTSDYGYRPRKQETVKDVEPDVAQNFAAPQDATEVPRNWEFVDRITGQVIHSMTNASYNQANAVQTNLEQQNPEADIYLRSVERSELGEAIDAISGAGVRAPVAAPKLKTQPPVKPVDPAVKLDVKKSQSDPYAQTYKKPVTETLPAKNLNQLYNIKKQLANPTFTTAEPAAAEKPVPAKPAQPRVHAALTDLQRQRDKVQRLINLKQEIETLTARAGRTRYGITPGLAADIEDLYPNPQTEKDMDAAIQGYEIQRKKLADYIARQRKIFPKEDIEENFADGKVKGKSRPGRVKRSGASCNGSVTDLRARAKRASGEKAKMYHWCANMKSGKKK